MPPAPLKAREMLRRMCARMNGQSETKQNKASPQPGKPRLPLHGFCNPAKPLAGESL